MTLGEDLIAELGRRGRLGQYFDYLGYQALRKVDDVEARQAFLDARGYASVLAAADPDWLADGLAEALADKLPPPTWLLGEPFGSMAHLTWSLTRLGRQPRVFPRRSRPESG